MKEAYIGVDIGSSGCKAIAVDGEGKTLGVQSVRYDNTLVCTGLGCYEQPARVLRDAGLDCIRALVRELGPDRRTAAIGLTGQMHGLVALDEHLEPLRPILSCVDFRNEKQNDEIYAKVGGKEGLLPYTNNKMVPSCTAGKILWMRENEPALFARTRAVVNPKDYVRTVLTGVPATDESDASGFGVYDVRNHRWNRELLDLIGLPEEVLPPVFHADQAVGTVLPEVAAELGLGPDTVVVAGAGDAIMQTVGSGAVEEGVYSVVLGSGGLISTSLGVCAHNEGARLQVYSSAIRDQWVAYTGLMSVGTSVNWMRESLYAAESARGAEEGFRRMDEEAARVRPGCDGLLFFPSLLGQRNPVDDPYAKGVTVGLTPSHTRGHLYRALLEGLAFGMREVYLQLREVGAPMRCIRISGGGAVNTLWCQIFADLFQAPVRRVPEYSACGALGAAVLASHHGKDPASLPGRFASFGSDRTFEPDASKKAVYDDLFAVYTQIYPASKGIFQALKRFDETH